MHLWWLGLFICGSYRSKWSRRGNNVSLDLLDYDHRLPLCLCLCAWYNQQKNAVFALWSYLNGSNKSFASKVWASLVRMYVQFCSFRNLDELYLHPHHFLNQLVWAYPERTSNKQHHHFQCPCIRLADDGRRSPDAVSTASFLL